MDSTSFSPTHTTPRDDGNSPADTKAKRKSSSSAGHEEENGKKKRRKVNHACVYCRRSHMTCDLERPCARCVKRHIGHLCHDEPREPQKKSKSDMSQAEIAPAPDGGVNNELGSINGSFTQATGDAQGNMAMPGTMGVSTAAPQLLQPTPLSPVQLQRVTAAAAANNLPATFMPNAFDWSNASIPNQFQDMHHLHPNYMFSTSEVTNEYNMLNEFLSNSLVDDGALFNYDSDAHQMFVNDPLLATSSFNAMTTGASGLQTPQPQIQQRPTAAQPMAAPPQPQATTNQDLAPPTTAAAQLKAGEEISRPNSTLPISEQDLNKFYLTAADPDGLSSAEDRLHKLLQAKYDAGMLKPFNYVQGYARLNAYMSKHFSRESQLRIFQQLDGFRPKFREASQRLTDMQLVLVEMWFERSLLEYDRVFASMAIPACCWRRTGEIFRGNREMAELVGVPWESLRDGKLAIHEIIAEDSLVSYWEKFGAIAFDQTQKAILTSCSLKRPKGAKGGFQGYGSGGDKERMKRNASSAGKNGEGNVAEREGSNADAADDAPAKCCFSFTIMRDKYSM